MLQRTNRSSVSGRHTSASIVDGTPDGLVATPITGGLHPGLLKLDEADGYLEMHPFAYRDLNLGDEVNVELRYPCTQL